MLLRLFGVAGKKALVASTIVRLQDRYTRRRRDGEVGLNGDGYCCSRISSGVYGLSAADAVFCRFERKIYSCSYLIMNEPRCRAGEQRGMRVCFPLWWRVFAQI